VAKALLIPQRQPTRWLKTQPSPGNFDGYGADVIVSSFGDTALLGNAHKCYCGIDLPARPMSLGVFNREEDIRRPRHMPARPEPFLTAIAP
jgi:hypothetical protein